MFPDCELIPQHISIHSKSLQHDLKLSKCQRSPPERQYIQDSRFRSSISGSEAVRQYMLINFLLEVLTRLCLLLIHLADTCPSIHHILHRKLIYTGLRLDIFFNTLSWMLLFGSLHSVLFVWGPSLAAVTLAWAHWYSHFPPWLHNNAAEEIFFDCIMLPHKKWARATTRHSVTYCCHTLREY